MNTHPIFRSGNFTRIDTMKICYPYILVLLMIFPGKNVACQPNYFTPNYFFFSILDTDGKLINIDTLQDGKITNITCNKQGYHEVQILETKNKKIKIQNRLHSLNCGHDSLLPNYHMTDFTLTSGPYFAILPITASLFCYTPYCCNDKDFVSCIYIIKDVDTMQLEIKGLNTHSWTKFILDSIPFKPGIMKIDAISILVSKYNGKIINGRYELYRSADAPDTLDLSVPKMEKIPKSCDKGIYPEHINKKKGVDYYWSYYPNSCAKKGFSKTKRKWTLSKNKTKRKTSQTIWTEDGKVDIKRKTKITRKGGGGIDGKVQTKEITWTTKLNGKLVLKRNIHKGGIVYH